MPLGCSKSLRELCLKLSDLRAELLSRLGVSTALRGKVRLGGKELRFECCNLLLEGARSLGTLPHLRLKLIPLADRVRKRTFELRHAALNRCNLIVPSLKRLEGLLELRG